MGYYWIYLYETTVPLWVSFVIIAIHTTLVVWLISIVVRLIKEDKRGKRS
jgi:hypothetical protein